MGSRGRARERDLFSDKSMLSERHIAHRTDSQHRKKEKERKETLQFRHQYKHEYTKLTPADYNFLCKCLRWRFGGETNMDVYSTETQLKI